MEAIGNRTKEKRIRKDKIDRTSKWFWYLGFIFTCDNINVEINLTITKGINAIMGCTIYWDQNC
jgi:hypothetical protein